jgi:hypothetical protein
LNETGEEYTEDDQQVPHQKLKDEITQCVASRAVKREGKSAKEINHEAT